MSSSRARKRITPYTVDHDNRLLVKLKYSGVHPLIALSGEFALTQFSGDKGVYLEAGALAEWHRKEGFPINLKAAEAIERAMRDHRDGVATYQEDA